MMVSNWVDIKTRYWCIRIYKQGGYSVSCLIGEGENEMWVDANDDPEDIPTSMLEDAKTIYRALHGKDMVW